MTRSLPSLAILLFLLLLNLVHSMEVYSSRHRERNSSILIAREDYSSFNRTGAPLDHHGKKTTSQESGASTTSSNQPSVTTIIIIQSNGQTYHELGGGPSPTNSGDSGVNDPNESSIEAQVDHDNEVVKRLISISTVVGGVGVVMIIAGTFIFIRLRAKRRRLKAFDQHSTAHDTDDDNRTDHGGHQRHFSSAFNQQHQAPGSPTANSPTDANSSHEAIEMSTIRPSAPPEPIILPLHLRERHRQSLLSQQKSATLPPIATSSSSSSPPAPSAPSAKELEMNLPSSSTNPIIVISSSKQDSHQLDTTLLQSPSSVTASDQPSSSSPPSLHLKPTAGSGGPIASDRPPLTPDMPPPAYTPSAPPLFILPPSQRRRSADQLSLDRYRRNQ